MDRNKSQLTHDVTTASAHWLEAHGFKPVETEVSMPWQNPNDTGWVADLASVIVPSQTELIEMRLLPSRPRWPSYEHRDDKEKMARYREKEAVWDAKRAALYRRMTCLVEVKTSRSDFRGDRKWKAPWPTDLAYLSVPKGLIKPEEYPAGWGILEDGARCVRAPEPRTATIEQHLSVVMAIAIRRDHHTRYERWREIARQDRIDEGERRREVRLQNLADAVFCVANGRYDSVEVAVKAHLRDCPEWLMERMRRIWRVAVKDG